MTRGAVTLEPIHKLVAAWSKEGVPPEIIKRRLDLRGEERVEAELNRRENHQQVWLLAGCASIRACVILTEASQPGLLPDGAMWRRCS